MSLALVMSRVCNHSESIGGPTSLVRVTKDYRGREAPMAIISLLMLLIQLANHGRCMKLSNIHSLGVPIENYCDAKLNRPKGRL